METFIKALPAVLAASGGSEEVLEAACIGAWKHAVGETLSARALPEKLHGNTLIVAVEDRIWQRQLDLMRDQFLFRLNRVLGKPLVKSLEFRIAPEKFATLRPVAVNANTERTARPIPIELISAAAGIEDPGLRKAFLGAAVSCVNRLEKSDISKTKSEV